MRIRARVAELGSLWGVSGRAAAAYGGGRLGAARRARRVRREGAWRYREALEQGLLDPAIPDELRRRYLSKHVREEAQRRLNPDGLRALAEDKLAFQRYCEAVGVPVPELYGTVGAGGTWSARTGAIAPGGRGFARLVDELPERFVVKPVRGYLGRAVHALAKEDGGLRTGDGRLLAVEELHDELVADHEFGLFMVQEHLVNSAAVRELHDSPVLQTARLITLTEEDGSARLLLGWLKLALVEGSVDNYRDGSGNAEIAIDVETGRLGRLEVPRPDGLGGAESPVVPGTGRSLRGRELPLFPEVRRLVLEAAPSFLPMRTLGWDVAVTTRGPVVVEANNHWGIGIPASPDVLERFLGPAWADPRS